MSSLVEWEARCRRCGRCCYEKLELAGVIYYTDVPCEHLDPVTQLCAIYPDRDRLRPGCIRLTPEIVRRGFLPADCPYCDGLSDYRPPRMWKAPSADMDD